MRKKLTDQAVRNVMHPSFMKACLNRANAHRMWASGHPGGPPRPWHEDGDYWLCPARYQSHLVAAMKELNESEYAFFIGGGGTRRIVVKVQQEFLRLAADG